MLEFLCSQRKECKFKTVCYVIKHGHNRHLFDICFAVFYGYLDPWRRKVEPLACAFPRLTLYFTHCEKLCGEGTQENLIYV